MGREWQSVVLKSKDTVKFLSGVFKYERANTATTIRSVANTTMDKCFGHEHDRE